MAMTMQAARACRELAQALGITPDNITEIKPIGGMTNRNFLCAVGARRYVVRIPGEGTGQMVNRSREGEHTTMAQSHGWHPEVVYFGEDGVKITAYVDGAQTLGEGLAAQPEVLMGLAGILRALHESDLPMKGEFSFRTEYDRYASMLKAPVSLTRYPRYAICEAVLPLLEKRLQKLGVERVPCHNDLVPENWLLAEKRLYLLDWEYSGYNDRAWDIAAYMSESHLPAAARAHFLASYGVPEDSEVWAEKLLLFEWLQHVLWLVWTEVKEQHGVSFGDYGERRLAAAMRILATGQSQYGWPSVSRGKAAIR